MALYVKSPEVDALAERLAARKRVSKTEAVRVALQNEWEREQASEDLVAVAVRLCREFQARSPNFNPDAADKAFIDSLYE